MTTEWLRPARGAVLFAVLPGLVAVADSFQRETTDDEPCQEGVFVNCAHRGAPLEWFDPSVGFRVNPSGSGLASGTTLAAVERSFETWEEGSGDGILFFLEGSTTGGSDGSDGQNVVHWTSFSNGSETFARSILTFDSTTGELLDVDIELNDAFQWAVLPAGQNDPTDPRVDVEAVVTHEAGHFLGLDHENRFGPRIVMYFTDTSGNTTHRTLANDDEQGVRSIYPVRQSRQGSNSGSDGGGGGDGCSVGRGREPQGVWPLLVAGLLAVWGFSRSTRSRRIPAAPPRSVPPLRGA